MSLGRRNAQKRIVNRHFKDEHFSYRHHLHHSSDGLIGTLTLSTGKWHMNQSKTETLFENAVRTFGEMQK